MGKQKPVKLNPKVLLLKEIRDAIWSHQDTIMSTKQVIPWAGTSVGPCYAVSTSVVGYELEQAINEIMETLRKFNVELSSTSETPGG
jgi:hypothetical protein